MLALASLALLLAPTAAAQDIVIDINDQAAAKFGLNAQEIEDSLRGQMDQDLKIDGQAEFLAQMGRANILAAKGMGADYATNPQRFVLGGGFGTAVYGAGAGFGRGSEGLPEGGFSFQAAALAGINLGIASPEESQLRRLMLYADGMVASTNPEPFRASTTNLGFHAQLKMIRPPPAKGVFEWGGLDLTSGYEWSRYQLSLSQELPVEVEDLTWKARGTLAVETDSVSVPVELSTNFRVFVLSLFLGGAADISLDSITDSEISVRGPVEIQVQNQNGTLGSASVDLGESATVNGVTGRLFGGAQVNILMVKAYGHLNAGLDGGFGGHLGVRVAM